MSIAKKLMTTGKSGPTYVDDVFSTYLYTGTGGTRDIVNGIDLDGEGGMVWGKSRTSGVFDHQLMDTVRGARKQLVSNNTDAEGTAGDISAFNSDGFSLSGSASGGNNLLISNGQDFVAWTFRKAKNFFDVVTWTGDGVAGREIPHNLGVEPGMAIVKCTSDPGPWTVTHVSIPDHYLSLETAASKQSDVKMVATDKTISWTGSDIYYNYAGREYVAYLFAHDDSDESMIKCGGYTGNGSTDGPEIDLGFEPQWVMIKSTTGSHGWIMHDTMRGWTADGKPIARLRADIANAEYNDANYTEIAVTPTGFRMTDTHASTNGSGEEYIYMAIRRPNKPADEFEADELFAIDTATTGAPAWVSGFPVDMVIQKNVIDTAGPHVWSRLTQGRRMRTSFSSAEDAEGSATFDYPNGVSQGQGWQLSSQFAWMWRRAPGFFDVVAYKGDGQVGREVPHNLGVAPEMMWIKARTESVAWPVYSKDLAASEALYLNMNIDREPEPFWNNTRPTAEGFFLDANRRTNSASNTYIAYLFASLPGISKVGSYTGAGANDVNVECGFPARFVLIKGIDIVGDWYLFDTVRGIVTQQGTNYLGYNGQDPYFTLNTSSTEVINTSWLDPYANGFTVRSTSAPNVGNSDINWSAQPFLFYAIA